MRKGLRKKERNCQHGILVCGHGNLPWLELSHHGLAAHLDHLALRGGSVWCRSGCQQCGAEKVGRLAPKSFHHQSGQWFCAHCPSVLQDKRFGIIAAFILYNTAPERATARNIFPFHPPQEKRVCPVE